MRTEQEIREYMKDIQQRCIDPDTGEESDFCYLDEAEQAILVALKWVVGDEQYPW